MEISPKEANVHAYMRLRDIGNQIRKVVFCQLLGSRLNQYRLLKLQLSQYVLTSRGNLVVNHKFLEVGGEDAASN